MFSIFAVVDPAQHNPQKTEKSRSNPTQPTGQPNPWTTLCPHPRAAFWNCAIRPSVCPMAQLPRRRYAGCLQLGYRRPPEMCGLWTRPRTDVDPSRFLDPWTDADGLTGGENDMPPSNCHWQGEHIVSLPPGRYLHL